MVKTYSGVNHLSKGVSPLQVTAVSPLQVSSLLPQARVQGSETAKFTRLTPHSNLISKAINESIQPEPVGLGASVIPTHDASQRLNNTEAFRQVHLSLQRARDLWRFLENALWKGNGALAKPQRCPAHAAKLLPLRRWRYFSGCSYPISKPTLLSKTQTDQNHESFHLLAYPQSHSFQSRDKLCCSILLHAFLLADRNASPRSAETPLPYQGPAVTSAGTPHS